MLSDSKTFGVADLHKIKNRMVIQPSERISKEFGSRE